MIWGSANWKYCSRCGRMPDQGEFKDREEEF